jgi:hypothetical protein
LHRRPGFEEFVGACVTNSLGNGCRVNAVKNLFVLSRRDNTLGEVLGHKTNVTGVEGFLHLTGALRVGNHLMRHMEVLHGVGQKLRAEHLKVRTYLEDSGLRVEMVD